MRLGTGLGLGLGSGGGLGLGGGCGRLGSGGGLELGGGASNGFGGVMFSANNSSFSQPQQQLSLENSSGLFSRQTTSSCLFSGKYTFHLLSMVHLYSNRRTNYCKYNCWWYNNKICGEFV